MNKSGWKAAGDRVLVKPVDIEEKTEGGIYLAKQGQAKEQNAQIYGVLVDVGPLAWMDYDDTHWANVGDEVIYGTYSGLRIQGDDGCEYALMKGHELNGVRPCQK